MKQPLHVSAAMLSLQVKNALRGRKRYPWVMMLEPLYACNLACLGCASERHNGKVKDRLDVDTCVRAAEDCGAPMVSICGGEPTLYPELDQLIRVLIARRRHIYLCTNGLLLDKRLFGVIPPDKRLTLNVHLDGMAATHDFVCDREGTFDKAIAMIGEAKERGYHVMTNMTVFRETRVEEIEEVCELVARLGVDGMLVSPGYEYESARADIFLGRSEMQGKFRRVLGLADRYRITSTPMFLEFAAGLRDYPCSPWSTVTFTPRGWKQPCYLIDGGFTFDWDQFWNGTDWDYWESRQDDRCQNCAMHSGFEASAVTEARKHPRDLLRMARWHLSG